MLFIMNLLPSKRPRFLLMLKSSSALPLFFLYTSYNFAKLLSPRLGRPADTESSGRTDLFNGCPPIIWEILGPDTSNSPFIISSRIWSRMESKMSSVSWNRLDLASGCAELSSSALLLSIGVAVVASRQAQTSRRQEVWRDETWKTEQLVVLLYVHAINIAYADIVQYLKIEPFFKYLFSLQ